ncbi:MAG TPA: TonB-dependent receptor [Planctomycetota bacterium]|nr:TonB-dependent receptor [Planctomycetota bacterium]
MCSTLPRRAHQWLAVCCLLATAVEAAEAEKPRNDRELAAKLADLSLDQLMNVQVNTVYAAARHEQRVCEAPAAVSIITAADIRRYGYRTLADIVASVPGCYSTYDRNYHHLGVRGFSRPGDYDSRVLVLVDGHRVNDNIYDSPPIGTYGIPDVALIERVEVIRGPGSALYGSNALLGVVNVVTKRGKDLQGAELAAEAASFGTGKARLTLGTRIGSEGDALFSASAYDSAGPRSLYYREYDDPATNHGVARNCDDDRYGNVFAALTLGEVTLQAAYVSREKGIPTAAWETRFNDRRTRTTDERGYLDLKWQRDLTEHLNVQARLYYDYAGYAGQYAYEDDGGGVLVSRERTRDQWWGAELVFRHTFADPPFDRHHLAWGVEYRDNFEQALWGRDSDVYLDERSRSTVCAVFLQDEIRILRNLTLIAGVRHDQYSTFGGTTNPRVSLIYHPFAGTTLKALYGRAFRAPNAYEMHYHDNGYSQKANPSLQPETIDTFELVLEQRLTEHLRLAASAFAYSMQDIVTQQVDPADDLLVFQNAGGARARGVEAELAGNWPSGLRGRLGYAFVRAEDEETGERLVNSPAHLARLNVSVPLVRDRLFASAELQYTSRRRTVADAHVAGFCVANFTLYARNLFKGLDASLSVYNLFDKRYADPGSTEHLQEALEQDGRTFRLQLTKRF